MDDDRRRSRLTTFFRLFLTVPHMVWLLLWGIVAVFAVIGQWFFALATGRPAAPLHRFLAAYIRYQTHVGAFLFMVANPFPGFTGKPGYPVDVHVAPPGSAEPLGHVLPRASSALPAFILNGALNTFLIASGVGGWFAALAIGRMPEGLRNAGAHALRYNAQVSAYGTLVTARYPFSGPPTLVSRSRPRGRSRCPRRSMRRPEHVLAALVLIAGAALGAWALWPTKVPDDLRLPPLDEREVFDPAQLREAQHFETFLHWNSLASMVVVLIVLGLYAWRGHRLARESAAGRIGTGMLLGMLGLGILWITQIPFGLAELWWARRYGVADDVGYHRVAARLLAQPQRRVRASSASRW